VNIRGVGNVNGHPSVKVGELNVLQYGYKGKWHGWGFNPSLRRLKDYKRIGTYGRHANFNPKRPWESEVAIGKKYRDMHYFSAVTDTAYCRHIGDDRGIRE
jgi:hypothetical protein